MRTTAVVVIALLTGVGPTPAEVRAQAARPFVQRRVCSIVPGQEGPYIALAREFVTLFNNKYPTAQMTAVISVLLPVREVMYVVTFPDLATYQHVLDTVLTDADYGALLERADAFRTECADELYRVIP